MSVNACPLEIFRTHFDLIIYFGVDGILFSQERDPLADFNGFHKQSEIVSDCQSLIYLYLSTVSFSSIP